MSNGESIENERVYVVLLHLTGSKTGVPAAGVVHPVEPTGRFSLERYLTREDCSFDRAVAMLTLPGASIAATNLHAAPGTERPAVASGATKDVVAKRPLPIFLPRSES